jgi:hypothetical protein
MTIDSVRDLKREISETILVSLIQANGVAGLKLDGQPAIKYPRTFGLGITRKGDGYFLAVRIQDPSLQNSEHVASIKKLARNEIDIRFTGRVRKSKVAPALQRKSRPVEIGCSIGHFRVSGGTLGAFVKSRITGRTMVLSNNHILADENQGQPGDDILQPGQADGGEDPRDRIGVLSNFVALDFSGKSNTLDCAVGLVDNDIAVSARLRKFGRLAGVRPDVDACELIVNKIGRTTHTTKGRVIAFEVDNVPVEYDHGVACFENQIEIEGTGKKPFSEDGDSGSLIFDQDLQAAALLFATSPTGGSNGKSLTYANHLPSALTALESDLIV